MSVCFCDAFMRFGVKGILMLCLAVFAAFLIAAQLPRSIRSATEIFFLLDCEALKSLWIALSICSTSTSCTNWLTSQSFCNTKQMRTPFAPPHLSEPQNIDADAQAVD